MRLELIVSIIVGLFSGSAAGAIIASKLQAKERKRLKVADSEEMLAFFRAECYDLVRHYEANLKILLKIDTESGKPSKMHLEKMKVGNNTALLFNENTKKINIGHTGTLHRIRLVIRNIDIEINCILDFLDSPQYNSDTMNEYLEYVINKHYYAVARVQHEAKYLGMYGRKNYSGAIKSPDYIIYETAADD